MTVNKCEITFPTERIKVLYVLNVYGEYQNGISSYDKSLSGITFSMFVFFFWYFKRLFQKKKSFRKEKG